MTEPAEFPLLENGMRHARECFEGLTEPDEDILPVMLWMGPYGMGIMPLLDMSDDEAKDDLAGMMTTTIACSRAVQAVMITTSWMVSATLGEDGKPTNDPLGVMPSKHPDRMEVVTAMHVRSSENSDGMSHAVVTRYPDKPPTLGEWEDNMTKANLGGRFGEAMHLGMMLVAQMPPAMIDIIDAGWAAGEQQDMIQRFHKVFTGFTAEVQVEQMDKKEKK